MTCDMAPETVPFLAAWCWQCSNKFTKKQKKTLQPPKNPATGPPRCCCSHQQRPLWHKLVAWALALDGAAATLVVGDEQPASGAPDALAQPTVRGSPWQGSRGSASS
jgi:hypothetical protein